MSEKKGPSTPQENLITKINYSPKIKGTFGMLIFGIPALGLYAIDRGANAQVLPLFMQGRLYDTMAGPWSASLSKLLHGDHFKLNFFMGIAGPTLTEIAQGLKINPGTYDPGDIAAFTIGSIGWAVFEGTAKAMHDSGFSLPIYRALGIRHRKLN